MTQPSETFLAEPVPPRGARLSVLVAGISGVFALISTPLVATPHVAVFGLACAVVFAAAGWAPVLWPSPGGIAVRRLLSFVILAITMILLLANLLRLGPANLVDLPATFGGFLGRMLISVLLAQLFITDKMRDLRVALLLTVGMFVLAVANEPGTVVVVALLVGWPAVVTALAFNHAVAERSKADVVAHSSATTQGMGWARVAWCAAVSALVAVLLVLLVPHPQGVHPRGDGGDRAGAGGGSPSGGVSRSSAGYTTGTMDMSARGKLPDTPMADVPRDSPQLWRSSTLDYYDGSGWRVSGTSARATFLPGGPHFDLSTGDGAFGTGAVRSDVVRKHPAFLGVVIAPGQPTALDVAGRLVRADQGFFVVPTRGGANPLTYTVTSKTTDLPSSLLSGTPVAAPAGEYVPTGALQLPDTVPQRVRLLGQRITRPARDRAAATRAVETYLRGHATYRLDSPVPKPGEDAVDNFLFVAHTGFCEQFAAAEVVLLRASGVPARMATGFAGGTVSGDHRTLLASDGHAWVEVWYPGVGWAASDPTAGTVLADKTLVDKVRSALHSAAGQRIAAGVLLVVTALAALLVWWLRRWAARRAAGRRAGQQAPPRPLPPVLAAFDRLQRALDDAGTPRAPAESVGELARRPAMRAAAGALAVVERTSYGALAPQGVEADDAERTLNELARQLREKAADRSAARA